MASVLLRVKDKVSTTTTSAVSRSPVGRSSKRKPSISARVIPPEPVQAMPEGEDNSGEAEPALQTHNLARANKNVQKLEWDGRLARDAKEYAEMLASTGKLEHSTNETQGENLFVTSAVDATYDDAVLAWMKEQTEYRGEVIGMDASPYENFSKFWLPLAGLSVTDIH